MATKKSNKMLFAPKEKGQSALEVALLLLLLLIIMYLLVVWLPAKCPYGQCS